MMNYEDCNFDDRAQVAQLYELSAKTAKNYQAKSVTPVPWRDPFALLEWYRCAYGREPGLRLRERVKVLGPQMARWERENGSQESGVRSQGEQPEAVVEQREAVVELGVDASEYEQRKLMLMGFLSDLSNARSVERVTREEREAYEEYRELKERGLDYSAQVRRWHDLTKMKREWAKTADAVEVAHRLSREWMRSHWEARQKELRTALDGRRLGMEAREILMAVADDPVEWRRVWDMEMERVIVAVLGTDDDNG